MIGNLFKQLRIRVGFNLFGAKSHQNITQNMPFLARNPQISSFRVKVARILRARQKVARGSGDRGKTQGAGKGKEGKGIALIPRLVQVFLALRSLARAKAPRPKRREWLWRQKYKGRERIQIVPCTSSPRSPGTFYGIAHRIG